MELRCPFCGFAKNAKSASPGRYTVKCLKSQCDRLFAVTVTDDPDRPPAVVELKPPTPREPARPEPSTGIGSAESGAGSVGEVTADFSSAAGGSRPHPHPRASKPEPSEVDDPNATVAKPSTMAGKSQRRERSKDFTVDSSVGATAARTDDSQDSSEVDGGSIAYLRGYRVVKLLGRGGMGAVYLARQLSLDRDVAIKVMNPKWARNPISLSRFTREAFAAAQLVHHNVVQIYDIGEDRDINFFSMEFVEGESLADLLREKKRLNVEEAVNLAIQAARGLKFAHDQGMVHRDIKPANLMINQHGIVKVADLGLVKAGEPEQETHASLSDPSRKKALLASTSDLTMAKVAMGTPSFMAPEQAEDAASVDPRADIYSLGCTLYALLSGRPPFEGKTSYEILMKHAHEPVLPLETAVKGVPRRLSVIVEKMVAKKPEDRQTSMAEVIRDLEGFLSEVTRGPVRPTEEHAKRLAEIASAYHSVALSRLRPKLFLGFHALCLIAFLLSLLIGQYWLAGGILGLQLLTTVAYFTVKGQLNGDYFYLKVRELVFQSSWGDRLMAFASVVLGLIVLWAFGLFGVWLGFCVVAVGIAFGFYFAVDRKIAVARSEPIADIEEMLRSFRLKGMDEGIIRSFVAGFAGEHWEELYEDLFGYEAMIAARGDEAPLERKHKLVRRAAWREPALKAIKARGEAIREERERKHLRKVELKRLKAEGVDAYEAHRQSERAAQAMVNAAAQYRHVASLGPTPAGTRREAFGKSLDEALRQAASKGGVVRDERPRPGLLDLVLGPKVRFLVGAAMVVGCSLWMKQNDLVPSSEEAQDFSKQYSEISKDVAKTAKLDTKAIRDQASSIKDRVIGSEAAKGYLGRVSAAKPLRFPLLPAPLTRLFDSFAPGVAGLLLVMSSLFRGWRMSLFLIPAAAVGLLGPHLGFVPSLGPLSSATLSSLAALALSVAGFFLGRSRE